MGFDLNRGISFTFTFLDRYYYNKNSDESVFLVWIPICSCP